HFASSFRAESRALFFSRAVCARETQSGNLSSTLPPRKRQQTCYAPKSTQSIARKPSPSRENCARLRYHSCRPFEDADSRCCRPSFEPESASPSPPSPSPPSYLASFGNVIGFVSPHTDGW